VIMGLVVMGWAVAEIHQGIEVGSTVGFIAAIFLGGFMIYCVWLMLTTTAFWVIRVHDMVNLFQGLYAAGRWPVGIYPNWLRSTLTFLVPIAFAVTIPAEALTGRLTPLTLAGAAALTIFLMLLARGVWLLGVRNYSGASA
jgi:ABC-2 type transport system permease protein